MALGGSGGGIQLLLLCCCCWAQPVAASDYDDYPHNESEALGPAEPPAIGPRAIPAAKTTRGNVTFLVLPASTREQLRGPLTVVLLPSIYALVCLVGLPANALALWVLATRVETLPSTVFLVNLAAADLLLGLVLPLKSAYHFLGNHWPFGEALCRATTAAFYGNMYCSVLLLACISVDRYVAVAHPFFSRSCRSPAFATGTCATVWALAALASLPLALQRQAFPLEGTEQTLCHDALPWEDDAKYYPYFMALVAGGFLLPVLVMALSCGAMLRALLGSGQKYATAIKLTALVLFTAVASFTPSNILLLLHYSHGCAHLRGSLYVAYVGCLALSATNSCLDPFIYYYASEEFRAKVRGRLFRRRKAASTPTVSLKTSKEEMPLKSCPSEDPA